MIRAMVLLAALLVCAACQVQQAADATDKEVATDPLASAISAFLDSHVELGRLNAVEPVPDWAQGERRRVRLTSGSYLFYFHQGRVVTVYRDDNGRRVEVYREEIPSEPTGAEGERLTTPQMPAHEVLDSVETISDGTMADILVASFSKATQLRSGNLSRLRWH